MTKDQREIHRGEISKRTLKKPLYQIHQWDNADVFDTKTMVVDR